MVGTSAWIPVATNVNTNTTHVSAYVTAGQSVLFRVLVLRATPGIQSVPSATLQFPPPQPLTVTTLLDENDSGLGQGAGDSLREVIKAVAEGTVINFAPTLAGGTIALGGTTLVVDKSLVIDASALQGGITINAGGLSRVFRISSATTVALNNLTILGGNSTLGGGINNSGVALSLTDCVLSANTSPDSGGAIYNTGGSSLTLSNTTVSNNTAVISGGGICNSGGGGSSLNLVNTTISGNLAGKGAGICNDATGSSLSLSTCTLYGNIGASGGGIYNSNAQNASIAYTSFSSNTATNSGGGIYQDAENGSSFTFERSTAVANGAPQGGALFFLGGSPLVENSTLAANASTNDQGGAILSQGSTSLTLRNCTIAANNGVGVVNQSPAALTLDNTIVANDVTSLGTLLDVQGDFTAVGANLVRIQAGTLLAGPSPLTADPVLGPIGFYGGGSECMPPLVGSPVIAAGVLNANTPHTDQENALRPNSSGAADIGAIQSYLSDNVDLLWVTTSAGPLDHVFRFSLTNYTVTVPYSVATAAVRAAASLSGQTLQVRINGGAFTPVASRAASPNLPLNPGANALDILVTAQNGTTTRTYTINIIQGAPAANNAGLVSLTAGSAPLSPAFAPALTSYNTFVANNVTSTTVTATPANSGATMSVRANLGDFTPLASGAASAPLALDVGANAIDVRILARDGVTTTLYTVVVTREAPAPSNADLAALSTTAGALSPGFNSGLSFYHLTVPNQVATTTVTASPVQSSAKLAVRVNGAPYSPITAGVASGPITLHGGVNLIEVLVTAADGVTVKSYSLVVTQTVRSLGWASYRRATPAAPGNDISHNPSISSDGRYVAFSSRASNLVPNDTNNSEDVFVYDSLLQTLECVSVNNAGQLGDFLNSPGKGGADSSNPSISADGRYVAFESYADNLVPNDIDQVKDIFVYDRTTRTIELVSPPAAPNQPNSQDSQHASISGDGRYVAFDSAANLVLNFNNSGDNEDVYIYDRTSQSMAGIATPFGILGANRTSQNPAVSSDGNFVAFEFWVDDSDFPQFQYADIYLYNRASGTVQRITGTEIGVDADGTRSLSPAISANGRYVAFQSNLDDLDFYDTNASMDVFVFDTLAQVTTRVSASPSGQDQLYEASTEPAISGDGRYVALQSQASNLVSSDTNGFLNIFVKDMTTGLISLISVNSAGVQGDADSSSNQNGDRNHVAISLDGRSVAFQSDADNMGIGDNNGKPDIFVAVTAPVAPASVADLTALSVNLGPLSPGFNPEATTYSASVSNGMTLAFVRPVTADPAATLQVSLNSGAFTALPPNAPASFPLIVGANTIAIQVTAADGSTMKTYTLAVTRAPAPPGPGTNAALASLVPSAGVLTPAFASSNGLFAVVVPNPTTSISFTPVVADPNATVTVNGATVASGTASSPITLSLGSTVIIITVTAQDGLTRQNYSVTVTRTGNTDANLANLVPNVGALTPAFASGTLSYTETVPNATTSMTLTPTVDQINARVQINGVPVASGSPGGVLKLAVGTNIVNILVIAQDGVTENNYVVTLIRTPSTVADLASLIPSVGTLAPVFASGTTAYTLSVPAATSTIMLTSTVAQVNALILINGAPEASGLASSPISLVGGTNTITVAVYAQDGVTVKSYVVTATRSGGTRPGINISRVNNALLIQWSSAATAKFQIQWTPTLKSPAWNTLTNIISSSTTSFSFLIDGSQTGGQDATQFYRLIQIQ